MTRFYCIWISNFGLKALKVPGTQSQHPNDRWKDMMSLPACNRLSRASLCRNPGLNPLGNSHTHPSCGTSYRLLSDLTWAANTHSLLWAPPHAGPCAGAGDAEMNPGLQGWRRCSGIWVLRVSGVWVTIRWLLDNCNFSTKRKKEKYIDVLFSSPDQTRWAGFRIICH